MKIGVILPMSEVDIPRGGMPSWGDAKAFAQHAEAAGLDSVWVFDHFYHRPPAGPVEGQHEGWTTMVAAAAMTERVEVGSLVLCSSFRHPGLLAKMAQTLDEVSGGRLILGLGAGWHDPEYDAFGFPKDHRVDRFEDALRIVLPLLAGERVTVEGRHTSVHDAALVPAPSRHIPILVAASGPRMLRLTASYADAWNTAWFGAPDDELTARFAEFDGVLAEIGRDRSEVERTVGVRIAGPEGEPHGGDGAFAGSVDEVARILDDYEALGADHLIVGLEPIVDSSLDHLVAAIARRG
jgi:alkanesulfonate monooxygenase SsuD/methylene tetrahydromethanopterin reductase-like flavin-dependent oxidoreductase (luciferase family)